jgi:uncharacterized protein YcfJ
MKTVAIILFGATTLLPAQAQLLRPESVEGALWGGLIGGIVGGDRCHGFSGEGAAIGAGVGLLAGTLLGESRRYDYDADYGYDSRPSVNVSFGYGYESCGSSAYVYYAPNRYCAPGTYYRATRPNYVVSGTVLGAASGALIGAADHHAGQGALIGAGTGLLLGGVAEHAARSEERVVVAETTVAPAPAPMVNVPPAAPKPGVTSTPSATSTYYWTERPQIPDAPRVPDAPTF